MPFADRVALELLAPLAVWVFASGLDDLVIDLSWFGTLLRSVLRKRSALPALQGEPRIAVLVPCWREHDVIEQMARANVSAIEYGNYELWFGLYPNDGESIAAAKRAAAVSAKVRWVIGDKPGPTTKADNLNQLVDGIFQTDRAEGKRREIFLFHDAEDVVHPQELKHVAEVLQTTHMVQLPVLPLPTSARELTHGTYADEFAEHHLKDLRVRDAFGGFIPSAGVATALRREVVERLRISRGDEAFNPRSLTEDYFLGLEVRRLGFRQRFTFKKDERTGELIASRSYFPRSFWAAVRQRSRWVAGNNLQAWERFGWRSSAQQIYWLWRDRKGLLNQIPTALAALLCGYCGWSWAWAAGEGIPWLIGEAVVQRPWLGTLLGANGILLLWRLGMRACFGLRVYGWRHAAMAPVRILWANAINFCASVRAVRAFADARRRGRPLVWAKTAHSFPAADSKEASRAST